MTKITQDVSNAKNTEEIQKCKAEIEKLRTSALEELNRNHDETKKNMRTLFDAIQRLNHFQNKTGSQSQAPRSQANAIGSNASWFEIQKNIKTKLSSSPQPPRYMLEQLEKIVDKQKNKKKYKKFGVDISNVIFCQGNVSMFTCHQYIEALAGELGRNLIRLSGAELENNSGKIKTLFEQVRNTNEKSIIFIYDLNYIGLNRANNEKSRDAHFTLKKECNDHKNENILVVLQRPNSWDLNSLMNFECGSTNPQIINFSYSPYGDAGSKRDIELLIRQRLDFKKIPYDYDLDISSMAERVLNRGKLCIEQRLNKAAEIAIQLGHKKLTLETFDLANQEIKDGNNGPTELSRDKRRLAVHEAGHAIAGHLLGKNIDYITIIADTGANKRGNFAYGKVSVIPSAGQEQSATYLKNQIVFFLASRAAEELFVGEVFAGVHGDMALAHSAAKKLVLTLTTENRVPGRKIELSECSNKKKEEFDDTVDKIIQEQYQRAKALLLENKEKHELLVEALLKYKRLSRSEFLILFETGKLESIEQLKKDNLKNATTSVKRKPKTDKNAGKKASSSDESATPETEIPHEGASDDLPRDPTPE